MINLYGPFHQRSASTLINTVDLNMSRKTIDPAVAAAGEVVTYTISLVNAGTLTATATITDPLLLEAPTGRVESPRPRSVRGTVTIDANDPDLHHADEAVRRLMTSSLSGGRQPAGRPTSRRG